MSPDYNGTDKSKCGSRHRAAPSSPGKGRWPCRAVRGFCQSQAQHPPTDLPSSGLQLHQVQGLFRVFYYTMGLHAAASPRRRKHTFLKHFERVQLKTYSDHWKQGETGADFFYRWFIFRFKNYFLCMEEPLRKHCGAGRLSSYLSSKREKVWGDFWAVESGELRVRDVAKLH